MDRKENVAHLEDGKAHQVGETVLSRAETSEEGFRGSSASISHRVPGFRTKGKTPRARTDTLA